MDELKLKFEKKKEKERKKLRKCDWVTKREERKH